MYDVRSKFSEYARILVYSTTVHFNYTENTIECTIYINL